ncbi:MAG: hypothetical protein V1492_01080 [Candidatus Micrarchaeota archaeon]
MRKLAFAAASLALLVTLARPAQALNAENKWRVNRLPEITQIKEPSQKEEQTLVEKVTESGRYLLTSRKLLISGKEEMKNETTTIGNVTKTLVSEADGIKQEFEKDALCGSFFKYKGAEGKPQDAAIVVFTDGEVAVYLFDTESITNFASFKNRFNNSGECGVKPIYVEPKENAAGQIVFIVTDGKSTEVYPLSEDKLPTSSK